MANDGFVQVPPNSTGGKVDCSSLSVGGAIVARQRVVIGDPSKSAGLALVSAGSLQVVVTGGKIDNISATVLVSGSLTIGGVLPGASVTAASSLTLIGGTDGTLARTILTDTTGKQIVTGQVSVTGSVAISNTVTVQGQVSVTGQVAISNTLNVNAVAISGTALASITNTVTVQGQVSAVVTGTVAISNNLNISAMPAVVLAAGAANIGSINGISATVNVAVTNHVTIDFISATVNVAGTFTIGTINNISATVLVAGSLSIGGFPGNTSVTVGSSFTLIGGTDGSLGRVALMDAAGHQIISGTVALTTLNGLGKIDGISANVNVVLQAGANNVGSINNISATVLASITNTVTVQGQVTAVVTGTVALAAGTNNIGTINNISATVLVAGSLSIGGFTGGTSVTAASSFTLIGGTDGSLGRVALMDAAGHQIISGTVALAAGAANIGSINNISATVLASVTNTVTVQGQVTAVVTGTVALAAGSANIGSINNISATVLAQITNHVTIDFISATVNVAGTFTIGTINNISATVIAVTSGFFDSSAGSTTTVRVGDSANSAVRCNVVAGNLSISGTLDAISASVTVQGNVGLNAGTNNIGFINGISATVNVAGSLTIGGIVNSASITAGTTLTLVGGSDGLISHILGTDTQGRLIMAGVLNSASVTVGSQIYLMGGCDGTLARTIATDSGGKIRINDISATVMVAGSFTVGGGQVGNASATVGSVLTLIGGMDGSLARVALTDAAGHFVVTGTVALAAGTSNIGTINNISATVVVSGSLSIGGFAGNSSVTAASSFTLIGGTDGSLGRVALMDAAGHQIISGTVALTTLNGLGKIDGISANVNVVLQAGANNIGTINNISAAIVLAAGAANIGSINNISANVNVVLQAGTANIGAVSLGAQVAAGTSVTAASVVVLAGGTSRVSAGITGSAAVSWLDPNGRGVMVLNHPSIVASATQGPQNKDITATAFATLVASAGASFVYVTGILVTNGSASVTGVAFASSDQTAAPQVVAYLAANGGGFNKEFNPPWKLSTGTALQGRIFPTAALTVTSVISFYVGP